MANSHRRWRRPPRRALAVVGRASCLVMLATGGLANDGAVVGPDPVAAAPAPAAVDFIRQVKPILARHCYACHGPETAEAGLRFDDRASALGESDSGLRAIEPGDVESSELIARITADDPELRMPLDAAPLSEHDVATLKQWIAEGAEWREHWAFQPLVRPRPPAVGTDFRAVNEIDAFVAAKLQAAGLSQAPPASRRVLARRASFDLTGLPATHSEVAAFEQDNSPGAWQRYVERLLASPRYGEHWARHWLDVVRFAETNSFERDAAKPNAWKYRDYVIRAFNQDKPFDQFVREQLAGDELERVTEESIIATGYYRIGIWDDEPADPEQSLADEKDDLVSTTSQAFLGLTIGCARCHDHKIDPIPQVDYYGLVAFFADVTSYGDRGDSTGNNQWVFGTPKELARRRQLEEAEQAVDREKHSMEEVGVRRMSAEDQRKSETPERQALLDEKLQRYLNASEWELYRQTAERLEKIRHEREALPPLESVLALAKCLPQPSPTYLMERGNPHVLGDPVEPRFPRLFDAPPPTITAAPEGARSAGRRRVLAEWIASPDNRLTARVIVNRVWQHHFGRGIVRSANNFGELGDPPTHPELLDWLACWLIDHDWKIKDLHRLIMESATYQLSSRGDPRGVQIDPANDLWGRFDLRRLSGEEVRDATLLVCGALTEQLYGPSVYPKMPREVLATQSMPGSGWSDSPPDQQTRRSVYIHLKRSLVDPLLSAFDFPETDSSCEARFTTTQPQQSLAMLNGALVNEQAARLAQRIKLSGAATAPEQIDRAFEFALARRATQEEIEEGVALLDRLSTEHKQLSDEALRQWCLIVLNLNEFLYVE